MYITILIWVESLENRNNIFFFFKSDILLNQNTCINVVMLSRTHCIYIKYV